MEKELAVARASKRKNKRTLLSENECLFAEYNALEEDYTAFSA